MERERKKRETKTETEKYSPIARPGISRGPARENTRILFDCLIGGQGDWAEAADLILRPRDGEKEEATSVRRAFAAKGDVGAALRALPGWMHVERSLLEGYRACGPRAHANALQRIPRNMRLMYVHAYQVPPPPPPAPPPSSQKKPRPWVRYAYHVVPHRYHHLPPHSSPLSSSRLRSAHGRGG